MLYFCIKAVAQYLAVFECNQVMLKKQEKEKITLASLCHAAASKMIDGPYVADCISSPFWGHLDDKLKILKDTFLEMSKFFEYLEI